MSEIAFYQSGRDACIFIRKQFGEKCNEGYFLGKFFEPFGNGFSLIIDAGTLQLYTQNEALWMIEHLLEFPKPHPRYLDNYFIYRCGGYIPRVSFEKLRKKIEAEGLKEKLKNVMCYERVDPRRQAVLVEISNVARSCWIDNACKTYEIC